MHFSTPAIDGSTSSSDGEDMDNRRPCPLLKYRLMDVNPCDQHGSRNRCMSIVPNWLRRIVCRNDEKPVVHVQFPERLVVSVRPDGVVVLKTSSPSILHCKSSPEVWLNRYLVCPAAYRGIIIVVLSSGLLDPRLVPVVQYNNFVTITILWSIIVLGIWQRK